MVIFIFALFSSSPLSAQTGSKTSKKDLENKKSKLNDEIKEINTMINETKANKKSSLGALVNINMKIELRQELINTINSEIAELNKQIKQNEFRNDNLKASLIKLKSDYSKMILHAQRNQDTYNKLLFIFSADNFNQAYVRLKYMQQYNEFRKKQAIEIVNTQSELLKNLNELRSQKHEKNVLLGNEQDEKELLNSEKVEHEQVLTSLQQKEKELKQELEKKKQDAIALQVAIKKLIAEEIKRKAEEAAKQAMADAAAKKAKLDAEKKAKKDKKGNIKTTEPKENKAEAIVDVKPEKKENLFMPELTAEAEALSDDFENNRGKLPWPVAKGLICEPYGEHEHPLIKGFMVVNNGVEMCVTKGTQARAIFAGEVTGITIAPNGSKLVIVRHGEYLSVYTNLSDVLVKTGQKIAVKQAIGTIMFNEDDAKASMNFQIWKGQRTMDPSGWLFSR